ncbi:MAG: hypothetical protein M0C28_34910 [Candidatus Moduliflexus flocculans]|nr:hypothetical protein [Candidatus Moduliflexus flocculans]
MENKGTLTKVLAVAGTIFVWLPILAPILFSAILTRSERTCFLVDYLMPAELGLFAFGGGILLLVAAIRARSQVKLIGWGLGTALVMMAGVMVIPMVTGLADGSTPIGGWEWMLVLGILALYTAAVIAVGVGGVLLLRDLFKHGPLAAKPV